MNYWTEQSIIFAEQKNYLDELFKVYPLNPNLRRELFLRHDRGAIKRNPQTVNRLAGNLYQIGIDAIIERCTAPKGVDFLAKFNGIYIAGEAKFLTDFGGHQNAQFDDALSTLHSFRNSKFNVIPIAIIDGVIYIKNNGKMYKYLKNHRKDNIMSALVLREFLYSI